MEMLSASLTVEQKRGGRVLIKLFAYGALSSGED